MDKIKNYLKHLLKSWKVAGYLIVNGVFPNIWAEKAHAELGESKTRQRLLEFYGIKK